MSKKELTCKEKDDLITSLKAAIKDYKKLIDKLYRDLALKAIKSCGH